MRKPKAPTIISVAISTTITIIFWIFIALYQILTASPDPVVDPELLKQIDPTIDTALLQELNDKVYFEEGQSGPPLPSNLEAPEPTESPSEPSPEPSQVPESTESAELET